jgi:HrpA-like RNA helicase
MMPLSHPRRYSAEAFGHDGLVVCTQPRAVAAKSIACRVSQEFDGLTPGASVGYETGRGRPVSGTSIMFTTDATLVKWCQRDRNLSHVAVVIIDEAHERSIYTDLIVGICKQVAARRKGDFKVVIASATIDPVRTTRHVLLLLVLRCCCRFAAPSLAL